MVTFSNSCKVQFLIEIREMREIIYMAYLEKSKILFYLAVTGT